MDSVVVGHFWAMADLEPRPLPTEHQPDDRSKIEADALLIVEDDPHYA